jgi:pseudouridine-5'-phosphate glycosidase
MNVVGVTQSTFAAKLFGRAAAIGLECFSFFVFGGIGGGSHGTNKSADCSQIISTWQVIST